MADARFEDGADRPLWLGAADAQDLQVIASLIQDAVLTTADITWAKARREFALLVNRFRWEDREAAERARRPVERVRAILLLRDVLAVRTQGIDPRDRNTVLSLLDISFASGADGAGTVTLTFAGDGAIAIDVEALDVTLRDVTRPYAALSGRVPDHG